MSEALIPVSELLTRARTAFGTQFASSDAPPFAGIAPGRVNLMGDHVDYAGGLVLPMAIDRWTVAAAAWSPNPDRPRLLAVDLDETAELDLNAGVNSGGRRVLGAPVGHWSGYIAGVFHELLAAARERGREARALDIAVTSSVPRASGLSSSAALELSIAALLDRAWNVGLADTRSDLALACQRAEHLGGGVMCGPMDQLASLHGRERHALLIDCRDLTFTEHAIAPTLAVLVVDTRTPRRLSAGKYSELVSRLERARTRLGVASLRVVDHSSVSTVRLDPQARTSARHFLEENARVPAAAADLQGGNAAGLARAFAASHASLRDRLGVSCPEIETVVSAAARCAPDVAARLTGAGMGGCAVIVCPAERAELVERRVRTEFETNFRRECGVLRVRAAGGSTTSF